MIISYDMYDIYMIYQPFEQLESLYLESKLITSKNFIGTYFGHMVTISDLGAGPQSRPLPLVIYISSLEIKGIMAKSFNKNFVRQLEKVIKHTKNVDSPVAII